MNTSEAWKKVCIEMLQEIEKDGKISPKYTHSCPHRCCSFLQCSGCFIVCCTPCFVWDALCCSLSVFCKNPFKYGTSCKYIDESLTTIFQDERNDALKNIRSSDLDPKTVAEVFESYMKAFDSHLATNAPKKANICRATLVKLIRDYYPNRTHIMLKDDGNVQNIRNIVTSLKNQYKEFHEDDK